MFSQNASNVSEGRGSENGRTAGFCEAALDDLTVKGSSGLKLMEWTWPKKWMRKGV
jgi:hypothetical protein